MPRWPHFLVALLGLCAVAAPKAALAVVEFDRAAEAVLHGDHGSALRLYRAYLVEHPQDRLAPIAASAVANLELLAMEDTTAALASFERVYRDYPEAPQAADAARQVADCHRTRAEWEAAAKSYRTVLELAGRHQDWLAPAVLAEIAAHAAECFRQAGHVDDAIATYKGFLEADVSPDLAAVALRELAGLHLAQGDSAAAAESYVRLLTEYSFSPLGRGVVAQRGWLDRFQTVHWRPYDLLVEGDSRIARRDYAGTIELCDQVLADTIPPLLRAHVRLRRMQLETVVSGDFRAGCRQLESFLDEGPHPALARIAENSLVNWRPIAELEEERLERPDDPDLLSTLGEYYLEIGAAARGIEALEAAIAQGAEGDRLTFALGRAYAQAGRAEDAAQAYERYLERHPQDLVALNLIGYSYLGLGRPQEALSYFRRYAELAPDDPNAHDSLAEGLLHAGQFEESVREYETALSISPDFTNSQFMLGRVYQQMGKPELAATAYQRFLEKVPDGPQADEARAALEALEGPGSR